jgi:hypothetical protein
VLLDLRSLLEADGAAEVNLSAAILEGSDSASAAVNLAISLNAAILEGSDVVAATVDVTDPVVNLSADILEGSDIASATVDVIGGEVAQPQPTGRTGGGFITRIVQELPPDIIGNVESEQAQDTNATGDSFLAVITGRISSSQKQTTAANGGLELVGSISVSQRQAVKASGLLEFTGKTESAHDQNTDASASLAFVGAVNAEQGNDTDLAANITPQPVIVCGIESEQVNDVSASGTVIGWPTAKQLRDEQEIMFDLAA